MLFCFTVIGDSEFERLLVNNFSSKFIVKKQKMVEDKMQRVWG